MPLEDSVAAQRNEEEVQENNSSRHDSVTAAMSNGQTISQALTEVETGDISKQSPSPLHHTFLLGRARFTAQLLSALISRVQWSVTYRILCHTLVQSTETGDTDGTGSE